MKTIRIIITALLISMCLQAQADNALDRTEERKVFIKEAFSYDIEEIKNDRTYSFIYEVYGKSALNAVLFLADKPILEAINDKNFVFNEEAQFTGVAFDTVPYFLIFSFISIGLISFLWLKKIITKIYSTAGSGEFLGDGFGKSLIIGSLFVTLGVVPINNIPAISYLLLAGNGFTIKAANEMMRNSTDISLQTYPEYILPTPFGKKQVGFELIEFASCVIEGGYAENKAHNVYMPFEKEGSKFTGKIQLNNCHAQISIEEDSGLINRFKEKKELSEINSNIEQQQIQVIQETITQAMNSAFDIAKVINRETTRIYGVYSDANFNIPVSSVSSLDCAIDRTLNTRDEIANYITQQSNCISKDIADKLVFSPQTEPDVVFSPDALLYGKARACSAQNGSEFMLEDLADCVKQVCEINPQGDHTGLYECSVVSSAYEEHLNAQDLADSGFSFAPIVFFNQYVNRTVSVSGRQPYNTLTMDFKAYLNEEKGAYLQNNQYNAQSGVFSVPITINRVTPSQASEDVLEAYKAKETIKEDATVAQGYFKEDLINMGKGGEAGIAGSNKFLTCVSNQYYIDETIQCGSLVNEVYNFSYNVAQYLIHYSMYSVFQKATTPKAEKNLEAQKSLLKKTFEGFQLKNGVANVLIYAITNDYEMKNGDLFTGQKTNYDLARLGLVPVISAIHTSKAFGAIVSFAYSIAVLIVLLGIVIIPLITILVLFTPLLKWLISILSLMYHLPFYIPFVPAFYEANNAEADKSILAGIEKFLMVMLFPIIFIFGINLSWTITLIISDFVSIEQISHSIAVTSSNAVYNFYLALIILALFMITITFVFYSIFSLTEFIFRSTIDLIMSNVELNEVRDRTSKVDQQKGNLNKAKELSKMKKVN